MPATMGTLSFSMRANRACARPSASRRISGSLMASNSDTSAPAMKPLCLPDSSTTPTISPAAAISSIRPTSPSSSVTASRLNTFPDAPGISMVRQPIFSKSVSKRQCVVMVTPLNFSASTSAARGLDPRATLRKSRGIGGPRSLPRGRARGQRPDLDENPRLSPRLAQHIHAEIIHMHRPVGGRIRFAHDAGLVRIEHPRRHRVLDGVAVQPPLDHTLARRFDEARLDLLGLHDLDEGVFHNAGHVIRVHWAID